MLLVILVFFKNQSVGSRLAVGLLYAVLFIPLTYLIDRFAYRNYERRSGKELLDNRLLSLFPREADADVHRLDSRFTRGLLGQEHRTVEPTREEHSR